MPPSFPITKESQSPVYDENELLQSLRESASDDFEVVGFLGRREPRQFVFLARERSSGDLVALVLEQEESDGSSPPAFSIEVARELDGRIPDAGALCPRCQHGLRKWARFCTQCGTDISGVGTSGEAAYSRATLLAAVREEAGKDYEVLGEMPRREGGGLVYFGRERTSGRIVALRLDREDSDVYSLNVTRVLKPLPKQTTAERPRAVSLVRRFTTEEHQIIEEARRQRVKKAAAEAAASREPAPRTAPAASGGYAANRSGGSPAMPSGGSPANRSGGSPAMQSGGSPANRSGGSPARSSGGGPAMSASGGGAPVPGVPSPPKGTRAPSSTRTVAIAIGVGIAVIGAVALALL